MERGGKHEVDGPVDVRATLAMDDSQEITQGQVVLQPGEMKTIIMKAPSEVGMVETSGARLRVEGRRGSQLVFTNTTHVATTQRFLTILVQTSRPIYTGGQMIEFRVVLLRRNMKPYEGPVDVYVMVPGLPKPGWWRVKVVAGGQVDEHPFLITKYFTSRFEVLVDMPFYTLASEESISGKFMGRFITYKPVVGIANVTVFVKDNWKLPDKDFRKVFDENIPFIDRWHDFRYPLEKLLGKQTAMSELADTEIKVQVTVQHTFLDDVIKGFARTRIVAPQVKLEFVGSTPFIFKPGMSYSGADKEPLSQAKLRQSTLTVTASVTLASGGTKLLPKTEVGPEQEERDLGERLREEWMWQGRRNTTTTSHSSSDHLLHNLAHHAVFARYRNDGILLFTVDVPEGASELTLSATYNDRTSSTSATARGLPVHSPRGRYLHITTSTTNAHVGEFAIFQVRANFRMDTFQYMVMAKGVMIYSATEEVFWAGTEGVATLSVTVSKEMSPRFTLAVLHVATDGEVLVDTVHVSVSLQHSMKRTVEAAMWAPPGALVNLACTRSPTWRKQQNNRITHTRLIKAALQMEPHPRSVHTVVRSSRSGLWTEQVAALSTHNTGWWPLASLHLAGLTILTDAFIYSPPYTGECDHQLGFLECGDGSCYRQYEVCDGHVDCTNAADEHNCLTVLGKQPPATYATGKINLSKEEVEVQYRLKQRNWWQDLFDQKEGSWCRTQANFGHKGYESVKLPVPNSPDQWIVEGFVTHPQHGFLILPEQKYDATPPLLMQLEASSFCRRGEQVSVRVHLYNSLQQTVVVMLVLPGSDDYRFINVENDATVSHYSPRLSSGDHHHLLWVEGERFTEVMLPLAVVRQSGSFSVTVHARSQVGSDTRSVNIKVQTEGAEVRKHTSVLLDLKNRATVYEFLDLPVDESPEITKSIIRRYVYGSPRATLALSGDVFGPTMSNMVVHDTMAFNGRILKSSDGLAFNMGSTVWTLHYLRLTNQLNKSKAKKAFAFINLQLAGLLTRYNNGSFKMWHFSNPSVWLTTWVLTVLLAAQHEDWENLVYVEPRLVNTATTFILDHQEPDGSFRETIFYNITLDHKMGFKGWGGGVRDHHKPVLVALTALVTAVLLEAAPTLNGDVHARALNARQRATQFLERELDQLWDPYDLAITTYALTLVGSPEREVALKMLEAYARNQDGRMYWSRAPIVTNARLAENNQRAFLLPKEPQEWDAYAVEATSYALLVFLIQEGVTPRTESIMRWLNSVREHTHAFAASVDTVVAMRALAEYSYRARLRDVTNMRVNLEATSSPGDIHSIPITNHSVSALHTLQVPRPWGHVYMVAKGSGQAVAQLEVSWGVDLDRFMKKPARKWTAVDISETSHAALVEVEVATGYLLYQPDANKFVRKAQAGDFPMMFDAKSTPSIIWWQLDYHFESMILNTTSLAALDICEVCGSHQCPYCPYYSGDAFTPRPGAGFTALLALLALFAPKLSNFVVQRINSSHCY
ncbi:CD109 antigen-like 1 [Homarus americanus]|uniref:CD109 antigen-like 1 n=1 Tax=Homarus americanus TaxID=6706 RepID=A0A8J5MXZ3_HOMAM|nr:CD109 antigen-like 1 [Homarus americanus]